MLDFPNHPYRNQVFQGWMWDGSKWISSSRFPPLPEAPYDGSTYGRRNAAWSRVLNSGGGTVTGAVTLTSTLQVDQRSTLGSTLPPGQVALDVARDAIFNGTVDALGCTNVRYPESGPEAANKYYVDSSLREWRHSHSHKLICDGHSRNYVIPHQFDTRDVIVCVYDEPSNAAVPVEITTITTSQVLLTFAFPPLNGKPYRVVIKA